MKLYYADIRGVDEKDALYPALSPSRGSALGVSLLAAAYRDALGAPLPKIVKLFSGKPVTADDPERHFSISHSKTHVFCAVSKTPVGVDTETRRPIRQSVVEKLTTPGERAGLSFFDIWVLRESLFKLKGEGDLRAMRFYKRAGRIVSPEPDVFCRLYADIEGSSAAVSSYENDFPEHIIKIPIEKLLKKEAVKRLKDERRAASKGSS